MKTIIVYSSQTGFTKRYADWLAEKLRADVMTLAEAKKQDNKYFDDADGIIYGGWAMGGKIVNSEWFKERIPAWKGKKLVLFCVGASPNGMPEVEEALHNALTDEERKYAKAFYCQGGISYEKMKLPSKLAMKAFAAMVRKKKDATEQEKDMGEMISHSYDISDQKFLIPIVEYVREETA
ncbi:MAG: flavodoxin [Lachnospiraceae bacterium]|nr:flavodoxin [Lachnospiraceae bacterium]